MVLFRLDKTTFRDWIGSSSGLTDWWLVKKIFEEFPEAAKQFQEFSPTHMWIPKKLEKFQED